MYVLLEQGGKNMTRKQQFDLCFNVTCELGFGDKGLYCMIDDIKNDIQHTYYIVLYSLETGAIITTLFESTSLEACLKYLKSLLYMKRKKLI